jgi:hypothetical protein
VLKINSKYYRGTCQFQKWKMINVHHMYNKGTTPLSYGVGSTHYGAHPM